MIAAGGGDMVAIGELLKKLTMRGAETVAREHPSYFVGDEWTPTKEQIEEARKRQQTRRSENAWRLIESGTDLDVARAAILCAAERVTRDDPKAAQRLRTIRALVFDSGARIFTRKLRVSTDRYLIELHHPRLTASDGRAPIGLRFIGLSVDAWKREDSIGLFLDGTPLAIATLFGPNFEKTIKSPDLAESYVRFRFDHELLGSEQLYLISDESDFILDEGGAPDRLATSQFRLVYPSGGPDQPGDDALSKALKISKDSLVPPTFIPPGSGDDTRAIVFTTLIVRLQLYHLCWELRPNGNIVPLGKSQRLRTPDGETLPLVAVRSFAEQIKALDRASDESDKESL
jgi:hypothetical protein